MRASGLLALRSTLTALLIFLLDIIDFFVFCCCVVMILPLPILFVLMVGFSWCHTALLFFLSGFYTHIVQSVIPISIVICFVEDYGREREIWGSIIFIIQTQTPSIINKVRLTDPHWFDYSPPRKPSLQQVIIILYNGIWWWLPWPGSHIFFLWW